MSGGVVSGLFYNGRFVAGSSTYERRSGWQDPLAVVLGFAGVAAGVSLIRIIARRGVAFDHGEGAPDTHRHP